MTCDPATCPNGKCNATGECVERMRPAPDQIAYCRELADERRDVWKSHAGAMTDTVEVIAEDGNRYKLDDLLDGMTEANLHPEFPTAPARERLIDADSATRKTFPMARGLLDYFPDALAAVAQVSFIGNEKHNPGEEMHHARGKSMDHADCIMRHLVGRGGFDGDTRHSAALAWRALALLQEELEGEMGLSLPRGARA